MSEKVKYTRIEIINDIRARIASGELKPGDKLPRHADARERYGVCCATLNRAYKALQATDDIISILGQGTFVYDESLLTGVSTNEPLPAPEPIARPVDTLRFCAICYAAIGRRHMCPVCEHDRFIHIARDEVRAATRVDQRDWRFYRGIAR